MKGHDAGAAAPAHRKPAPTVAAGGRRMWAGLLSTTGVLMAGDLLVGALAYAGAWLVRIWVPLPLTTDLLPQERFGVVSHYWPLLAGSQLFMLYVFGLYDDLRAQRYREVLAHLTLAVAVQVSAITSVFYFTNGVFPRSVILVFGFLNLASLTVWRFGVKRLIQEGVRRVLVVGESLMSALPLAEEIEKSSGMGFEFVGMAVGDPGVKPESLPMPVLGSLEEVRELVIKHEIDEIIFASRETWKDRVFDGLSRLQTEHPLRLAILPSVYEIAIGRLRHINIHDTPLIEIRRNPNEPVSRLLKRSFDLALSLLCLVLFLPVGLVIAVVIALTSPGPVFYLQERVGRGGRVFRLIKFRTMVADAEKSSGEVLAGPDDPRITPVGAVLRRFRLDEIPQFLNVLKGDMSFVGPRPERPGFVRRFTEELPGYAERHKVKPGMTGLAQVRGYYHTTAENKLRFDLAYIYNYSFSLDLLILLETLKVILTRRGS